MVSAESSLNCVYVCFCAVTLSLCMPCRFDNREGQVNGASDVAKQNGQLKKEFGFFSLVAFLFGGMVGSGIFISPAFVLRGLQCGGWTLIIWLAAGIIALLGGLCYAELGSLVRNAGGEFAFILKAFSYNGKQPYKLIGELLAFSAVWTHVVILRPASLTIVLLTFAEYTVKPFYSSNSMSTAFLKVSIAWVALCKSCLFASLLFPLTQLTLDLSCVCAHVSCETPLLSCSVPCLHQRLLLQECGEGSRSAVHDEVPSPLLHHLGGSVQTVYWKCASLCGSLCSRVFHRRRHLLCRIVCRQLGLRGMVSCLGMAYV